MKAKHLLALTGLAALSAPASAQALLARYQLNETAGNVCADSSGNGLNGIYRGGFSLGSAGAGSACATSVDFDGSAMGDVIITSSPPLQTLTSSLSVSAWINPASIPVQFEARRIFGNNNGGWTCGLNGDGLIFTTRFVQDYLLPGVGLTPGAWTHVAFVFDSAFGVTFYVDGINVGFVAGGAPANLPNPDWFIGGFNGTIEFWDGLLDDIQIYSGELTQAQVTALAGTACSTIGGTFGTNYCMTAPNSSGLTGTMSGMGSTTAAANSLTLIASGLPNNQFGIFVTSRMQGFVPMAGGTSNGNLCLSGILGRFSMSGQILNAGSNGEFSLAVDTAMIPEGGSFRTIMAGDTWNFQAWHRDGVGLGSNFTDGLEITFN